MSDREGDPLVRPLRQALVEIGVFSILLTLLTAALAWLDPTIQRLGWTGVPKWLTAAGATLQPHIGWYYGALIPLLLGFYAFVGGGQLLGVPHVQRSRRNLGFVAELLASATLPPFLVLICGAVMHANERVLVIVLVPVQAVVLFLGAQLGGFIVFDRGERYRAAVVNADAARAALRRLRNRSRRSGWLVLAAHAVVLGFAEWLAAVGTLPPRPIVTTWSLLVALMLLAAVLSALFIGAVWFVGAATDRVTRVFAWFVPYGIVLFLGLAAASQEFTRSAIAVDAAVIVLLAATLLSTHVRSSKRWLQNWTLGGAGRRIAAREVVRRYSGAVREARSTRPVPAAPQTFASTVRKWMQASLR